MALREVLRVVGRASSVANGRLQPEYRSLSLSGVGGSSARLGGVSVRSGEARPSESGRDELLEKLSDDQVRTVEKRTQEMWKDHVALKTKFPKSSLPPEGDPAVSSDVVRRKRLLYRSKQRGWLEVDLLLGTWADANVPSLSAEELDQYEDILNCETVDIFAFISGNSPEIPAFVDTPMMRRLQAYVRSKPLGISPEQYASAKRESNLT